jgi:phosphatidylserine synthase
VVIGAVLVSRILPSDVVSPPGGWFRSTLLLSTLASAMLMVSRVPYPHLVNRFLKRASPVLLAFAILAAGMALAAFGGVALSFAFWGYAVLGLVLGLGHLLHLDRGHSRHA